MKAEDMFHVGIVTDDLETTRSQLSELLRYEWGPEIAAPIEVDLAGGSATVEITCAYSTTTPRLEVIRSVPGTFWESVGGSGIHHVGYWSDDVGADAAELERLGYMTEATRRAPDGSPFFAFMRSDKGIRMELVTRAAEPSLRQCWADRS
ncbi:VOC family protein [Gordonia hankookensis]|uniref:VOC family protein n=1 Tax=Gordonia hankookensis TaxID=589403 RepID=A0ABR7WGV0_9ACTN|nr:VOC family protein [Gordonia hankookensis]MBD1321107.1 VOC family protein [Gordonia hankookensis]